MLPPATRGLPFVMEAAAPASVWTEATRVVVPLHARVLSTLSCVNYNIDSAFSEIINKSIIKEVVSQVLILLFAIYSKQQLNIYY
jgi:hypothetical protein